MTPRYTNITKEQQEFRNTILKKKMGRKRKITEIIRPEPITRETYMANCVFWIKEYYEKRTDKEMAMKVAFYLKQYCEEIIRELSLKSPDKTTGA